MATLFHRIFTLPPVGCASALLAAASPDQVAFYAYVGGAVAAIVGWAAWLDDRAGGGGGGEFVLLLAVPLGAVWPVTVPVLVWLWWSRRGNG